jgi:hypothetical protein
MSQSSSLWRCANCATSHFPRRLICPRCGSSEGEAVDASAGVIEQTTVVHRAVGGALPEPQLLATVLLDAGPHLIAGLDGPAFPGTRVSVRVSDGAIRATPAA